ncbi:3-isopropylmalate dehydratase large subunit [Blattabacterium cuenoti]|uniref:3-isopropylmalate dehydratase large subunit n=1 Tax=Blattabacterium cuenoti TaxID=1653831 RepID=UPI00163CF95C|nr:3-isopropylmalate dehydratase large subunit [Blattabacterium cuenoti]
MIQSLFDKIWNYHLVRKLDNGIDVIYIDRHYIHEVTSPQAFLEIEKRNISVFRPKQIVATADHNVPTIHQSSPDLDSLSRIQINLLTKNCKKFGISSLYGLGHKNNGIVHIIGPELGHTKPGMTIVCGDSHTSTHGAFGCIAFGIGTTQVAMVMASQCLLLSKPKQMRIHLNGNLKKGVTSKDVILYIISKLGVDSGIGYFVEYSGSTFQKMSMEERMTVCNMSIEMGAKGGLIAPDQKTFDYVVEHSNEKIDYKMMKYWKSLKTDMEYVFDREYSFMADDIDPMITYGTDPGMAMKINGTIPNQSFLDDKKMNSLKYMGFSPGESLIGKTIDYIFIGSCTNSRIEDLRLVASIVKGKKKSRHIHVLIVPGSNKVLRQAKKEGLDVIFNNSGLDFREPGCSACLGMNSDKIPSGKYCVSTSNRNFEGRQGPGSRTLLSSPLTAAVIAIEGKIVDINKYIHEEI